LAGLLPGGATEEDFIQIWKSEDWLPLKEKLVRASLLVCKVEHGLTKYMLLPFMNKYAEALLSHMELKEMHKKCI